MSVVEEALVSRLKTAAGLAALVGDRVYPMRLPQAPTVPAVVYQRISTVRETTFGADPGLARVRFQVTAWADEYSAVKGVATQARLALERWRGTVLGVEILDTFIESDLDLVDDEAHLMGVATDAMVIHREAVS